MFKNFNDQEKVTREDFKFKDEKIQKSTASSLFYLRDSKLYSIVANNHSKLYRSRKNDFLDDENILKQKMIDTKYENFAGMIEEGEDKTTTRKRELFEETNGTIDLDYQLFVNNSKFIIVDGKEGDIGTLFQAYQQNTEIFRNISKNCKKNGLEDIQGFYETNDLTIFEISQELKDNWKNPIEGKHYLTFEWVGRHKTRNECYWKIKDIYTKEIWVKEGTVKDAIYFSKDYKKARILEIGKTISSYEDITWKSKKTKEKITLKSIELKKVNFIEKDEKEIENYVSGKL